MTQAFAAHAGRAVTVEPFTRRVRSESTPQLTSDDFTSSRLYAFADKRTRSIRTLPVTATYAHLFVMVSRVCIKTWSLAFL